MSTQGRLQFSKSDMAELIKDEMRVDLATMDQMQKDYALLQAKYNANKAWLEAYGFFPIPGQVIEERKDTEPMAVASNVKPVEIGKKIHELVVDILQTVSESTITDLYEEIVRRGKKANRASLDRALRRFPQLFHLEMRNGKNYVTLKQKEQKTA